MSSSSSPPIEVAYKYLDDRTPVLLDVHLDTDAANPQTHFNSDDARTRPVLVYFHGGGLTVGNKESWTPHWLKDRAIKAGWVYIAPNYRLMPPATGHEIVDDIKDLFAFIVDGGLNKVLEQHSLTVRIDSQDILVAGSSAGGLCAYLTAMHATPTPRAVLSLFGQGGNFLIPQYLTRKSRPFLRGRELLDSADFPEYMHPVSLAPPHGTLPHISDSALRYHGAEYRIPGFPANPRMLLSRLYLQMGVFLDYYTGLHEPSLSDALSAALSLDAQDDGQVTNVPEEQTVDHSSAFRIISSFSVPSTSMARATSPLLPFTSAAAQSPLLLFPQFALTPSFPPTFLLHGSLDTAVLLAESVHLHALLSANGVEAVLEVVEGEEHSFDYQEGAEEKFNVVFGRAWAFLERHSKRGKATMDGEREHQ